MTFKLKATFLYSKTWKRVEKETKSLREQAKQTLFMSTTGGRAKQIKTVKIGN